MRPRARQLLAALALLVAVGCGSDDEPEGAGLPQSAVSQLERRLAEIDRRYNDALDNDNPGACADIENDSFPAIEDILAGLPGDVDPDVRQATQDSFARLRELASEGCSDVEPPQTETTPPETDVETVPPEPPPPPETETTPPQTEPTPPPDEREENGNGNGNGNGNRGGGAPPGQQGGGGGLRAPQQGGGN